MPGTSCASVCHMTIRSKAVLLSAALRGLELSGITDGLVMSEHSKALQ